MFKEFYFYEKYMIAVYSKKVVSKNRSVYTKSSDKYNNALICLKTLLVDNLF